MSDKPSIDESTDESFSESGEKKSRGRPKWLPTPRDREQVRLAAGMGLPVSQIAILVGVSEPTLRRACKEELEKGGVTADLKVAANLYRQATDPTNKNPAAAIFWMKAKQGWRDRDPAGDAESPSKKQERKENARKVGGSGRLAPGKPPKLSLVKNHERKEEHNEGDDIGSGTDRGEGTAGRKTR